MKERGFEELSAALAANPGPSERSDGASHLCMNPGPGRWICSRGHGLRPGEGYGELGGGQRVAFNRSGGRTLSGKGGLEAITAELVALLDRVRPT